MTRAKQQISLDVAQSYLQVVLDQKIIDIADKNYKASKDRQTLLEEQNSLSSIPPRLEVRIVLEADPGCRK